MVKFLFALLVVVWGSDSHIALEPLTPTSSIPTKMLVFIPGGNVPGIQYVPTAVAIQEALSTVMNLWIVIPAVTNRLCIIECTTSALCFPLHNSVEDALSLASSKGWARGIDKTDMFLAGHSLGGTCANTLMQAYGMPYAALLVLGSYVDESGAFSVTNYSVPVMTLNVELDGGLARPGKTSIWWRQFLKLQAANSLSSLLDKPVIILPGLNHSDFCPGFNVPGDLMAEVSQQQATQTIAAHVAAYLAVQLGRAAPPAVAVRLLAAAVAWTGSLLNPYLAAENLTVSPSAVSPTGSSSEMCRRAQLSVSGLPATSQGRLVVNDRFQQDSTSLEHCHTNYSGPVGGGYLLLDTCSHTDHYADVDNTGGIEASSELACKLVSSDRIGELLSVATDPDVHCSQINHDNVALAISMAAPPTLQRYLAKGKGFCFLPDVPTVGSIGPIWVFTDALSLTVNASCMAVASPVLQTSVNSSIYPGNMYCKVISPERVLDWMMTDSLKP